MRPLLLLASTYMCAPDTDKTFGSFVQSEHKMDLASRRIEYRGTRLQSLAKRTTSLDWRKERRLGRFLPFRQPDVPSSVARLSCCGHSPEYNKEERKEGKKRGKRKNGRRPFYLRCLPLEKRGLLGDVGGCFYGSKLKIDLLYTGIMLDHSMELELDRYVQLKRPFIRIWLSFWEIIYSLIAVWKDKPIISLSSLDGRETNRRFEFCLQTNMETQNMQKHFHHANTPIEQF